MHCPHKALTLQATFQHSFECINRCGAGMRARVRKNRVWVVYGVVESRKHRNR